MANYQEMYLELARKTEQAIKLLIEVQQKCEDMYIENERTANVQVVDFNKDKK